MSRPVAGASDAAVETGVVVQRDGRNRRAAETRRKIIEAAKLMIAETSEAPTVVGVARRADVSVRSVFQHFRDVQSLFVTVMDSIRADLVIPQATPSSRPLAARIDAVIGDLAAIYDKVVPLKVAAGQFATHPALRRIEDLALEIAAAPPRRTIGQAVDVIAHIRRSTAGRRLESVIAVNGASDTGYAVEGLA